MRTKSTPGAHPGGEYDPFDDSGDSDSTDSDSSGTESLPEDSISRTTPAESLLPEDDPMDGTTTPPGPGEDAGPGPSFQTSKAVESSSTGEGVTKRNAPCDSLSAKAEKETEDKGKNDQAPEKNVEPAERERSGRDFGSSENQIDACASSGMSVGKGSAQQMNMHATNASSMEVGKTVWAAGEGSTALASDYSRTVHGQKEKINAESESGAYNPNIDSSASSSSGSPDTSEIREPCVSIAASAQRQLLETRKILEKKFTGTVLEHDFPSVEGSVVQNPETHKKFREESNKNDGVSCDRLSKNNSSDMILTALPSEDASKVSKFRQKLDRAAEGLPGRASVCSQGGVSASENTSTSNQPQATANEQTNTEGKAQFTEVEKDDAQSNIAQQLGDAATARLQPRNPPAAKESLRAVPSCETVKATVEKTTGTDSPRVSRFKAKLSETKKKGEFPAATRTLNSVSSFSTQNVQESSILPTSLRYGTRQTESNIEKNILQPDQGTLNVNAVPKLLSESQTVPRLFRPSVDHISCARAENSEISDTRQPLHLETNLLGEPHAHVDIPAKIGPEYASNVFDTGVRQRLKILKLQKIYEDDLKVLVEYCNGWFEAKSNLPIEQVPQESRDNAGRAFQVLKIYVDLAESVFNEHVCLPQGQFSQQVAPLHHGISKNAPPIFREIAESRVLEFANGYEKRNAEILKQEDEVIKALLGTAGDYFEEEAAFLMKNDYFEAQPLSILFSPIEELTKQSFLNASDIKFPPWRRKYSEMLDAEVQRRKNKIQSENERQRLKTQKEIDKTVDRCVCEYTQDIEGKLKNLKSLRHYQPEKFHQVHVTFKEKIMKKIDAEFVKKWGSCPGLHDAARKNLEIKIEEVRKKECQNLLILEAEQKGTAHCNSMTTANSTNHDKCFNLGDHSLRGTTVGKGASKSLAFLELPSLTVAIHMGLSRTRLGMFKPGTTEFMNIAEVENCLYYRDDSILLAYNDSDKQKLNPQDVNFQGGLVQGPTDELHHVKLNEKNLQVRKEHIISSLLAALKWKAELEMQVKLQNCVIVIPQFLNDVQKTCIRDAARVAGFNSIKFIDDTVAIAVEYMMRKKERERYLIVTSAMEGVVDVAKFHIKEGLLRRLEVTGTHFLSADQAQKSGWNILYFFTWSRKETQDILEKIFSNKELNLGKGRVDETLKLFAGDAEMFDNIKAVLKGAKNFEQVSELTAIKGGALFAALCEESQSCPLYNGWKSMRSYIWGRICSFDDFKTAVMSVYEKEKKRSSNWPEGKVMTVEALDIERKEGHLRSLKEVHDVALEAVKVIRSIQVAVSGKQIRNPSATEVLLQQLVVHRSTLVQPNLRLQEAKKIHDELLSLWYEHVQGRSSS